MEPIEHGAFLQQHDCKEKSSREISQAAAEAVVRLID